MSTKPLDQAQRKKRMMLLLPLFLLPFTILLFYGIGGGKNKSTKPTEEKGLNSELPAAKLKDEKNPDKLALYQLADRDSIKQHGNRLFDPFNFSTSQTESNTPVEKTGNEPPSAQLFGQSHKSNSLEENERKVNDRLALLQQTLNNDNSASNVPKHESQIPASSTYGSKPVLARNQDQDDANEDDPELNKLNQMLEKVLDVQHPERVTARNKELSQKQPTRAIPVTKLNDNLTEDFPETVQVDTPLNKTALKKAIVTSSRFFELNDDDTATQTNAIRAVVHQTQELVSGSTVKIRLIDAIYLHGTQIPTGTFVYGTCELSADRLKVHTSNISYANSIFPVSLDAFDLDGIAGIYEPGSISRDASKQSADQAMQSLQLASLNPSIGAQAAASGVEAMKTIIQRKVRLIRVTVKAGHQLLLYTEHP